MFADGRVSRGPDPGRWLPCGRHQRQV